MNNLIKLSLKPDEKEKFDENIKNILDRLNKNS
jgi:hypothetical protein